MIAKKKEAAAKKKKWWYPDKGAIPLWDQ
jgi:hypothetical protein